MTSIYEKMAQWPCVETKRLILRPVSLADAKEMYLYASDLENTRFVFPTNKSFEETKANIARIYLANPLGKYGIERKETGQFIGTFDFHHFKEDVRVSEIGYCLNKQFWNQGYITEAGQSLFRLAFDIFGLNRIVASHDKENPASGQVMKKLGMCFSHEEPYAKYDGQRLVTSCHYRLTKEKYAQQRRKSR